MHQKNIIHFTNSYESILNIINDKGFQLAYCGEIFTVKDQRISSAAHPMVCFSSYSQKDLNARNITYGRYGIQMKDTWVKKNKITPVLYVDPSSQVAMALGKLLRARQRKTQFELPEELRLPIIQLKCFTKNTQGYNSYFDKEDFNFFEENEWRFVPTLRELKGAKLSQNLSTYKKNKMLHKIRLSDHILKFENKDIEKVFIKCKSELQSITEIVDSDVKIEISPWITDLSRYV